MSRAILSAHLPQHGRFSLLNSQKLAASRIRVAKIITFLYVIPFFVTGFFVSNKSTVGQVAEQEGGIGNYIFIAVWALSFIILLLTFLVRRLNSRLNTSNFASAQFILLALLYGFEILSASWSSVPVGSLYHTIPNTLSLLYVATIIGVFSKAPIVSNEIYLTWCFAVRLLALFLVLLLLSALTGSGGFISQEGGILPRLYGSWFIIHPNLSSFIAMICILHYVTRFKELTLLDVVLLIVCISIFVLTQTRTQYIAACVAFIVLSFHYKNIRLYAVIGFSILFLTALTQYDALLQFISRGESLSNLTSLTGRVQIWLAAIDFASENVWLGWGAWSGVAVDFNYRYRALFPYNILSNIENSFLQVFIDCGVIGFLLFFLFLSSSLWRSYRSFKLGWLQSMAFVTNIVIALKALTGFAVISFDATQVAVAFAILANANRNNLPRAFSRISQKVASGVDRCANR